MLPSMKVSLMFVIWRNEKPWIVTDHSALELNAVSCGKLVSTRSVIQWYNDYSWFVLVEVV
jgi:hypothetical protein